MSPIGKPVTSVTKVETKWGIYPTTWRGIQARIRKLVVGKRLQGRVVDRVHLHGHSCYLWAQLYSGGVRTVAVSGAPFYVGANGERDRALHCPSDSEETYYIQTWYLSKEALHRWVHSLEYKLRAMLE